MSIEQVNLLERNKNYVRPMTDEEWGYQLFCQAGSLPVDCTAGMLRGWVRAWRGANPYDFDNRPFSAPALRKVECAENRADWIGA